MKKNMKNIPENLIKCQALALSFLLAFTSLFSLGVAEAETNDSDETSEIEENQEINKFASLAEPKDQITFADWQVVMKNYGQKTNEGDLNNDGEIDILDIVKANNLMVEADEDAQVKMLMATLADPKHEITAEDFYVVKNAYGQEGAGIQGDLNGDGEIDILDIVKATNQLSPEEQERVTKQEEINSLAELAEPKDQITFADWQVVMKNYGQKTNEGDLNNDGEIDILDIVKANNLMVAEGSEDDQVKMRVANLAEKNYEIDMDDLEVVKSAYGKKGDNLKEDLNNDGEVDIFDIMTVVKFMEQ